MEAKGLAAFLDAVGRRLGREAAHWSGFSLMFHSITVTAHGELQRHIAYCTHNAGARLACKAPQVRLTSSVAGLSSGRSPINREAVCGLTGKVVVKQ